MVHTPPAIIAQTTVGIQPASRQDSESPTLQNPPNPKAKIDSMSCIRKSFSHLHLPAEVAKVVMASWRASTKKQYHTHINKWLDFCRQRQIDPYKPGLTVALQFLHTLHDNELSYSAINTARSALSTILTIEGAKTFGTHPVVSRYLKGVFLNRKPLPKYNSIWDVSEVLRYLKTLNPNQQISLKELTLKLVMLLSLVTAQRGQSIHMLDISGMALTESCCTFLLLEHIKTSRPGNSGPCIKFSRFTPDEDICPIKTLNAHLQRTEKVRQDNTQLLLSYVKPFKPVSRDTISRWMKMVLHEAGIDTSMFKPHSTRAASCSKANAKSVPVESIMKAAGWSSENTFRRFYDKLVIEDDLTHVLLS